MSRFDWGEHAGLGLAGVLDPRDTIGAKNRLIDRAHKSSLRRYGGRMRGQRVLEFGSGNGRISKWLVERGADVDGVDSSPEMVAAARICVPEGRFEVVEPDKLLELEANSYDLVVSVYVMAHITEKQLVRTLSELGLSLKPDGRLIALEKVGDGCLDDGWTLAQYRQIFAAAGFALQTEEIVRLGSSRVVGHVEIRPVLRRLPWLPALMRLEASRSDPEAFGRGEYADFVFVAVPMQRTFSTMRMPTFNES